MSVRRTKTFLLPGVAVVAACASVCLSCGSLISNLGVTTLTPGSGTMLAVEGGGFRYAAAIDSDGDGVIDGLDLDGDSSTLEMRVIAAQSDPARGMYALDADGNGTVDYYLFISATKASLVNSSPAGTGAGASLVQDAGGAVLGLGTGSGGTVDTPLATRIAAAADAVTASSVTLAGGDSQDAITGNFTVPLSASGSATVAWASDNAAAIAFNGGLATVARPDGHDVVVTLTATITIGTSTQTKVFHFTVKATGTSGIIINPPPAPSADALVFQDAGLATIGSFTVTKGTPTTVGTSFAATSYAWYLDNASTALSTTQTCPVDPAALALGAHSLLLKAVSGGKSYSGSLAFTVCQHPLGE